MERVLVCGGRDFADETSLFETLDAVARERGIERIIAGGATGADTLAVKWAARRKVHRVVFLADWGQYGRGAGIARNQEMLDRGEPTLVVACSGGRGTQDMVRRARGAGLPVLLVGGV